MNKQNFLNILFCDIELSGNKNSIWGEYLHSLLDKGYIDILKKVGNRNYYTLTKSGIEWILDSTRP